MNRAKLISFSAAFLAFFAPLNSCGSGSAESPIDDIYALQAMQEITGREQGIIDKCFNGNPAGADAMFCSEIRESYYESLVSSSSSVRSSSSTAVSSSSSAVASSSSAVVSSSSSRISSSSSRASSSSSRIGSSSSRASSSSSRIGSSSSRASFW